MYVNPKQIPIVIENLAIVFLVITEPKLHFVCAIYEKIVAHKKALQFAKTCVVENSLIRLVARITWSKVDEIPTTPNLNNWLI